MAERTVVWTETAVRQRREILKYWTKRNGSSTYSVKLIKLVSKQINRIIKQPESFKKVTHPETRISALGHFSILYKITEERLIITAFWDNRQDPRKLLELLKN